MRPVTPQPGYASSDVTNLLATRQFVYADCFTITPKVGSPLRYTNAQQSVTVVPLGYITRETYTAGKVLIKGLRSRNSIGVEVDQQQVDLEYPNTLEYQAALTWAKALLVGRLDGAKIRRDRYFASDWGQPWLGGCPMFSGVVSTLSAVGRQSATVDVKSDLVFLDRQAPAYLWEPNCKNTWGDPACGVDQNVWAVTGTIGASPTRSVLPWSGSSTDYNLGKIHIENGDSVTRVRTVARATSSQIFLAYPLDFDPVAGMTFVAYPGCTRTTDATTGCPKYHSTDWQSKIKGFPFIPVAETAL